METINHLENKKIFFGHQSVGYNILEGMEAAGIKTIESTTLKEGPGCFLHARVGKNGDPLSKIEDFKNFLHQGLGEKLDGAFMKFCFIDIKARGKEINEVFTAYKKTVQDLHRAYPGLTLLHITCPLTTIPSGGLAFLKTLTKRTLKKPVYGIDDNIERHRFNLLLKKEYGEKVFDLAALESTTPEGKPCTYKAKGQEWPALVPEYTRDTGHLNKAASLKIGEKFLTFLAKMLN